MVAAHVLVSVAAACGGSAFTTGGEGDDGGGSPGDASPDLTTPDGGAHESGGGPDGVAADGGHADAGGGPDAITIPDVLAEAPPACSGAYACVPAVPPGWVGPLEVYAGPGPVPPCSPLFQLAQDANDQLDAGHATCGCQCSAPKVACDPLPVDFYSANACTVATKCTSATLSASTCIPEDVRTKCAISPVSIYMSAPQATASGASCAPQESASVPAITWGISGRACVSTVAAAQVDCPVNAVCAPRPAPPFGPGACIAVLGDVACPSQGYTAKHVFFTSADDSRGCTSCTCGGAGNASCTASVSVYAGNPGAGCSGQPIIYAAPFSCVAVDQPGNFLATLSGTAGSCPPSPSTPTGTATPSKPVTVCCTP